MKKRFITTLAAAAMLCSSLVPSALADDKTTVNILWWGSQTRHDLTVKLIEKFEELNPDIDVVMDYSDWSGYWTKLPAQVAGGQTPDVFQMDYAYLSQYAENGVLAELDSYIADGSLDMSDVSENVLASGQVNGKTYAISTGTNAPAMLYRKDILDELGLTLPMNPTMSEYTAVAKAVYEATGLRDTYVTDCSAVILRIHLRNYGLNLYNEDATALGFDDPKYLADREKLSRLCTEFNALGRKLDSLPKGIDSRLDKQVNEEGVELSGGEAQKLMMARALYKDAPVLVLDEPTAALDPIAENEIYLQYRDMTCGKTSLFISHRLASTRFCDRILLLREGRVAEEGTHEQLLALGGEYARLYEMQSCWYRADDSKGGEQA